MGRLRAIMVSMVLCIAGGSVVPAAAQDIPLDFKTGFSAATGFSVYDSVLSFNGGTKGYFSSTVYTTKLPADGRVSVKSCWNGGLTDNGFGLIFRYKDSNTFSIFQISKNGQCQLCASTSNGWRAIQPWNPTKYLVPGYNTLQISCLGSQIFCYINDSLAISATDSLYSTDSGYVGVGSASQIQCSFKDFVLISSSSDDYDDYDMYDKVICRELFRQGFMDRNIFAADEAFGKMLRCEYPLVLAGYKVWARPIAQRMRTSPGLSRLANGIVKPWSYEMAHIMGAREHGDAAGKVIMWGGVAACCIIGAATANAFFCDYIAVMLIGGVLLYRRWRKRNA